MENIAEQLDTIMKDCLFREDELVDGKPVGEFTAVEGVRGGFGLHPGRLNSHRKEVRAIIKEMPSQFHVGLGEGWSFLNLCMDKNGVQWGEHRNVEVLCVLAIGLGLGKWLMPRDYWPELPGGMPYIVFDLGATNERTVHHLRKGADGPVSHPVEGGRGVDGAGEHPADVQGSSPGAAQPGVGQVHQEASGGPVRASEARMVDHGGSPLSDINEGHHL